MIRKKFQELMEKAKNSPSKEEALKLLEIIDSDLIKQEDEIEGMESCLLMIREFLIKNGLKMDSCPPMFYTEAISKLILNSLKEVGAIPNCKAKFKWVEENPGFYKKIEIKNE